MLIGEQRASPKQVPDEGDRSQIKHKRRTQNFKDLAKITCAVTPALLHSLVCKLPYSQMYSVAVCMCCVTAADCVLMSAINDIIDLECQALRT